MKCYGQHFCYKVLFQGHVIGGVVAVSKKIAQNAAKTVKVSYEDLPHIITIEVSRIQVELYPCTLIRLYT